MDTFVHILGMKFSSLSFKQTIERIERQVAAPFERSFHLVTGNPEIVVRAQDDPDLRYIMDQADLITPDGIGIILASRWKKRPIIERVSGYDLLIQLLDKGNANSWSFYFLGCDEATSKKAIERILALYPHVKVAGRHHGFFDASEEAQIVEQIEQSQPDFLILALGAPASDHWIHKHRARLAAKVMMGVGGSLDIIAGKVKRAPILWQKLNLEWLYRLLAQPSRWRRQLLLPVFAFRALRERK